jgi:hypothetical protein
MAYCTTKNLDNCWLTAGSENSVWWFIDGEQWTDAALRLLDACLARLTYFGRTESVTFVRRSNGEMQHPIRIAVSQSNAERALYLYCFLPPTRLSPLKTMASPNFDGS